VSPEALWRRLGVVLVDLLFPPRCVGCARVGGWLCGACQEELPFIEPPFCPRCGLPNKEGQLCISCWEAPLQIDGLRAVGQYEGVLREAIHRFKYRRLKALAGPLGQMMGRYLLAHPLPGEVIVPVPLHPSREQERGYNQSRLLAEELGKVAKLSVRAGKLVRIRPTPPQVGLSLTERRENVRDAFRCVGLAREERKVLLVDDVCASGATMEACAQALYAAGAESVWGIALARPPWQSR